MKHMYMIVILLLVINTWGQSQTNILVPRIANNSLNVCTMEEMIDCNIEYSKHLLDNKHLSASIDALTVALELQIQHSKKKANGQTNEYNKAVVIRDQNSNVVYVLNNVKILNGVKATNTSNKVNTTNSHIILNSICLKGSNVTEVILNLAISSEICKVFGRHFWESTDLTWPKRKCALCGKMEK